MIYFFQKLWLIVTTVASIVWAIISLVTVVRQPCYHFLWRFQLKAKIPKYLRTAEELLVFREYRKARWVAAGGDIVSLIEHYIRHNGVYGKTILWTYFFLCIFIGAYFTLSFFI